MLCVFFSEVHYKCAIKWDHRQNKQCVCFRPTWRYSYCPTGKSMGWKNETVLDSLCGWKIILKLWNCRMEVLCELSQIKKLDRIPCTFFQKRVHFRGWANNLILIGWWPSSEHHYLLAQKTTIFAFPSISCTVLPFSPTPWSPWHPNKPEQGARFSKLPVITGPVKLFCSPF